MQFDSFVSKVKLDKIQTYNKINNNASDVFKNQFYDEMDKIDYNAYESIDNEIVINLEEATKLAIENGAIEKEWYQYIGDGVKWYIDKKIENYANLANTAIGFIEGVAEFGEDIFDAACWVGAAVGSLVPVVMDIAEGDWDFSTTGAYFNSVASFVSTDFVNNAFDSAYANVPLLKGIENRSGDWFKRDGGIVYGISESAGKYAATIAVSTVVPGGPVLAKGLTFGVAKFGDEIEKGIQKVTTNDDGTKREASLGDFAKQTLVAGAKGAVEGGIMAAATGISENAKTLNEIQKNLGLSDDVIKATSKAYNTRAIEVKAIKPLANELVGLANGEEFNAKEVLIETVAVVASENVASALKPYTPKISIKSDSLAPAPSAESIKYGEGFSSSNSDTTSFIKIVKSAVSEGLNKGIEKAEKETVKTGVDGASTLIGIIEKE